MKLSVGMLVEVVRYNHHQGGYRAGVIGLVTYIKKTGLRVRVEGTTFPKEDKKDYWRSYMWHDENCLRPLTAPHEYNPEDFL